METNLHLGNIVILKVGILGHLVMLLVCLRDMKNSSGKPFCAVLTMAIQNVYEHFGSIMANFESSVLSYL